MLNVLKTAPVPLSTTVPKNWMLNQDGVYRRLFSKSGEELEPRRITYKPIVISGKFKNVTDECEGLIVSWFDGRAWKESVRTRDYFMITNKITDLSSDGFPVNSNNAKDVIQYLTDFEEENGLNLPHKTYSEQLGWVGDGFLYGNEYISTVLGEEVCALPADMGEKQVIEGLNKQGDIDKWLNIIDSLQGYPCVMIGIYASLASVLCSILKVDSFILEWSGDTSQGKTIALKIAASVWGCPSTSMGGIIKKWNITPVNIERTASLLNNLPLFLDDTKDLTRTKTISSLIYNVASGQGKGRGSTKGSQKTRYWNNITFSTGEQKITTFTKDGGTAARVLPITGLPFGKADPETAPIVESVDMELQDCYGVAGRKWIDYILKNKDGIDIWKLYYRSKRQLYLQRAHRSQVIGRLAKYIALIDTAAWLFNECFEKDYDYESFLGRVWDQILAENEEVDRPLQAVKSVFEWAVSNQVRFADGNGFKTDNDYGIWESQSSDWKEIFFYPDQLSRFLVKEGYESRTIFKSWKSRGWLNLSKDRGNYKQKNIKGTRVDTISIKREFLEQ